jgi:hypothetical protein
MTEEQIEARMNEAVYISERQVRMLPDLPG